MRKLMLILAVAALVALAISCAQLKARDQLNKGVQAFTNAQYPEAVEHFTEAADHFESLGERLDEQPLIPAPSASRRLRLRTSLLDRHAQAS